MRQSQTRLFKTNEKFSRKIQIAIQVHFEEIA